MPAIFAESDKAGKRSDKRADAADIDTDEQVGIIIRKLRKQYRRRDIADALAREHGEKKSALLHEHREKLAHCAYTSHISRENKKENKCEKQRIIDGGKRLSVREKEHRGDDDKPYPIRNPTENYRYRQCEKAEIKRRSRGRQLILAIRYIERLRLYKYDTAESYQRYRKHKRRCHYRYEFAVRDIEFRIEIEILRIAERREHTAEICRDILHDKCESHVPFLACRREDKISERQKCQQSHIVCYQHGADESDIHEREYAHARIFENAHYPFGKDIEKPDVFQSTDDRQYGKKAGKSFEIKIADIFPVYRHYKTCYDSRREGNCHNGVFLYEIFDRCEKRSHFCLFTSDALFFLREEPIHESLGLVCGNP